MNKRMRKRFILGGAGVLLAALLAWAVWGQIPAKITAKGVSTGGIVVCFLTEEEAARVAMDMIVECDQAAHEHEHAEGETCEHHSSVTNVESRAFSYAEASELVGGDEETLRALNVGEWSYPVTMVVYGAPDGVIEVSIVTDPIRPIDLLLK